MQDSKEGGIESSDADETIYVDVIVPVYNASDTIEETVASAMFQNIPDHIDLSMATNIDVAVCCYDDGSSDDSWSKLYDMKEKYDNNSSSNQSSQRTVGLSKVIIQRIQTNLLIDSSKDGVARGAGFARNQAAELRSKQCNRLIPKDAHYFLVLLDSDDTCHHTRIAEQVNSMLSLSEQQMHRTIMGCNFDRDPPDSTWHYAHWANNLTDNRLMLERFREVTVLQPTWILTKARFDSLDGYIEAPHPQASDDSNAGVAKTNLKKGSFQLIHPNYDTKQSLRLAEDLRFVHAHIHANGLLSLHRTSTALVTYRHRAGMSQSSQTPRKLLLHLRVWAFESTVLRSDPLWLKNEGYFVVWGAGRDGKDFVKSLSHNLRCRVACFVDVDRKKIECGYYVNKDENLKIPIVHFSTLASNPQTRDKLIETWENEINNCKGDNEPHFGRIDKSKKMLSHQMDDSVEKADEDLLSRPTKKLKKQPANNIAKKKKINLDLTVLPSLPVVVCVAMYRTNGILEQNVRNIGRTEGKDLWHFS